ncbi:MAG: hypothetical protein Q9226_007088 [Calogaya cf. arnoldii]
MKTYRKCQLPGAQTPTGTLFPGHGKCKPQFCMTKEGHNQQLKVLLWFFHTTGSAQPLETQALSRLASCYLMPNDIRRTPITYSTKRCHLHASASAGSSQQVKESTSSMSEG